MLDPFSAIVMESMDREDEFDMIEDDALDESFDMTESADTTIDTLFPTS